jgi:hypothetical protein
LNQTNNSGNDLPETTTRAAGEAGTVPPENSSSSKLPDNGKKTHFLATRATALRGQSITPSRVARSTIRKNTEADLKEQDAEVPYHKTEKAIRDLVCSILERQDRMNEEIFNRVIDLQYRMDDLEDDLQKVQEEHGRTGAKE